MLRKLKSKGFLFVLLMIFALAHVPANWAATSLSDLSLDALDPQEEVEGTRDPFVARVAQGALDPSLLSLEGLIVGLKTRYCLISGRTYTEGQTVAGFVIKEISPGSVILLSPKGKTRIRLEGYVAGLTGLGVNYDVAFHNAGLKEAIRMVGSAANMNLIVPETVEGRVSLTFHNTSLSDALRSVLRVNGLDFVEENNIVRVGNPADFANEIKFTTKPIQLKYATAGSLIKTITPLLSEKGHASADDRSNIITLRDSQSFIDDVENLIRTLDKPSQQVYIEAKILNASRSFSRSIGIQWGLTKNSGRVQGFGASNAGNIAGSANPVNANFPAENPTSGAGILIGRLFPGTDLEAQISAAEENGDAQIISQPSITTLNNMPAKIRSGVKFFVKISSTIAVGGTTGTATGEDSGLEEIDTGIQLTVTPQITSPTSIKLKIAAEESEADFSRAVDGIPAVIDNSATTTVSVADGETTVIGGLMKTRKSNTTRGVPFLSSIPILGWLFKSKTKSKDNNELLIFITPRIVKRRLADQPKVHPQQLVSQVEMQDQEIIREPVSTPYERKRQRFNKHSRSRRF